MSFTGNTNDTQLLTGDAALFPVRFYANLNRFQAYIQEELSSIHNEINAAGTVGAGAGQRTFDGIRLWHEGDYRTCTKSRASFYAFLSHDTILNKEILMRRKRLFGGYRYEIRYSLTQEGAAWYRLFTEALLREGISISSLFVKDKNGNAIGLPYTAAGKVKYDFELEHFLIDYPRIYYSWHMEARQRPV